MDKGRRHENCNRCEAETQLQDEERERCGNQMSGKSLGSALAGTISPVCPTHVSDVTVSRQLQSLFS